MVLKIKDERVDSWVKFCDLPIGTVYRDISGFINIKVDDRKVFFRDEDGEWELVDALDEDALPLEAELVIKGRK